MKKKSIVFEEEQNKSTCIFIYFILCFSLTLSNSVVKFTLINYVFLIHYLVLVSSHLVLDRHTPLNGTIF